MTRESFTICPDEHKHELTSVCHDHHGCRCDWCVSESRARYQERKGNGLWVKKELEIEVEHLLGCGVGPQQVADAMGINRGSIQSQLKRNGRPDLAHKMSLGAMKN